MKLTQTATDVRTDHDRGSVKLLPICNALIFDLGALHQTMSWAIVGGGLQISRSIMWFQVKDHDLKPPVHPHEFLIQKIETIQPAKQVVGLLTSAKLTNYVEQSLAFGDYWVRVLATVGLGNALRAGDPPGPSGRIGTINLACQTSHRLSSEAMLESLSLMAEAKAAAVADGGVISRQSGRPATGTGTDCHVIATPMNAPKEVYAGKHTKIGYLIGESVYQAVSQGIMRWKGDHPDSKLIVPT